METLKHEIKHIVSDHGKLTIGVIVIMVLLAVV